MRAKISYRVLLYARRISQLLFFSIFVFLFIRTDYRGYDQIEHAVNILFRLDPYLAAVTFVAVRSVIALMLPAAAVLLLSLFLGRSFCGWFCPMGSLLDGCRKGLGTDRLGRKTLYPRLGLWLLTITLFLSFFGLHAAGYIDPFSILVRGLVQAVYPAFHYLTETFFTYTYSSAPPIVNSVTEPVYSFLQDQILPSEQKHFAWAYLSFFILAAAVLLEMAQKRFFCRNLCPLGAFLGTAAEIGVMQGSGGSEDCGKCRLCAVICRMGAVDENRSIDMTDCNLCMECMVKCPRQIITLGFGKRKNAVSQGLTRRQFVGAGLAGIILPLVKEVNVLAKHSDPDLIRPPGAKQEGEFLARCVRCGECMQVCIGNGLQPTLLQAGIDGLFSPRLSARTGYCEYNCTLCGQVCPTGALDVLSIAAKHSFKIGHAYFDKNLCLPYAKNIPCMVCEEHCPTAEKAIRFREAEVMGTVIKQPYVVDNLCIGCGICEYKCPLPGKAAIYVTSDGEKRHPDSRLPEPDSFPSAPYG